MHPVHIRIGQPHPVPVGNSLGQRQPEPGRPLLLRSLKKSVENPAAVQRRVTTVLHHQLGFCQCQCNFSTLRAVHKRVLYKSGHQNRGKSSVHLYNHR